MSLFDELRAENKPLADVLKSKKFSGIRKIVEKLYPDKAHFIYELLQNAEDTKATEVRFILTGDSLVFEHNGRSFDKKDIEDITNIGKGDGQEIEDKIQEDKIGRFGIGFKAVFAYSETPHIWSPTYSFIITELILPWEIGSDSALGDKTRFDFPFDNPKKPSQAAYTEIAEGLRGLADTTLLFLHSIKQIQWKIGESSSGKVRRVQHTKHHVEIVNESSDYDTFSSHFLRFSSPIEIEDGPAQYVSIAYELEYLPNISDFDDSNALSRQMKIVPADPGRVAVFFPAEKEASGLRFHLHAPFVPELSRASIKETESNAPLFKRLAELAASSLSEIRDLGLLTSEFLGVLPNRQDSVSKRYEAIREDIIEAMNSQPLTPTHSKSHYPGRQLLQAKATLKDLLSEEDVKFLVEYENVPFKWAAAASQRNTNQDRFLAGLAIRSWDLDQFVGLLKMKASSRPIHVPYPPYHIAGPDEGFMRWLSVKQVAWHQQMYTLLLDDLSTKSSDSQRRQLSELKKLKIVRLSDGSYNVGEGCYFPSDDIEYDDVLPRVDKGVYSSGKSKEQQEKAKKLLEELGVREVGEAEQVEAILKDRYSQEAFDREAFNPRMEDIKRFISLVEKEPLQKNLFEDRFIFKLTDEKWGKPRNVYLDSPFYDTGLFAYYGDRGGSLGTMFQCWALSQDYKECGISPEKIGEFAKKVGSKTILDIKENEDNYSIDYTIYFLDDVLRWKSLPISKLIWKTLVSKETGLIDYFCRYSRRDGRKKFSNDGDSSIIALLKQYEWVPQKNQKVDQLTFVKPADADSKFLPDGFSFDNGWKWVNAVAFGSSVRQREESERLAAQRKTAEYQRTEDAAKSLGFDSTEEAKQMAELKRKDPEGYKKWQENNKEKPSFPNRPVADPERRREVLIEELAAAPEKEYKPRIRSIRVTEATSYTRQWLSEQYRNDDTGEVICQICQCEKERPFKKRDGEYYFEAVEALSRDYFTKEHEAQFLALCPVCAAMYKEFVTSDDSVMQLLKELLLNSQELEIPLQLGERNTTLRFVETHREDLRTIIQRYSEGEG